MVLRLSGAEGDTKNSADQTDAANDRRKSYPLLLRVFDFQRAKLRVFFFRIPEQAAPDEANDADDDQNNANDSSRFHKCETTMAGVRRSIVE